jgi:hypothetical protein
MITKTRLVLFAALMLGAASAALASDGSSNSDGAEMRSRAHVAGASKAKHQISQRAYGANGYRLVPAPRRQPEADWLRMNCDLPIGC